MPEKKCTKLEYKNLSDKFHNKTSDFTKQYCSIYNVRIEKMRQLLLERIEQKWNDRYPISKLNELSVNDYSTCIIIGTLFKDQKLKPSILKQLSEANSLIPQPVYSHYTDETDCLYLEDEVQRLKLLGVLKPSEYVTGISCALLGNDVGNGKFMVEDICFADYRPQIERPRISDDQFVIFISGINLINIKKSLIQLQLFANWLAGALGDYNDIPASKIVRVIIAGNSVQAETVKDKITLVMTARSNVTDDTINSVKQLDTLLLQLAQTVNVDVMPGEHDPSNHVLPQKSMHHCMFPSSSIYKTVTLVSNPYECEIGGCRVLGTSGQPINDIRKFSDMSSSLEALESCLKWNHLAPTAPDTLGCFPYYDSDPFIIEECPHVLFAGNQERFESAMVEGTDGQRVRTICVPEFYSTHTVCALNLKNLDCFPISFNTI